MTRVGAYDCGTNSLRVLVADLDPETGASTELARELRVVRLGQGVDRTGRIADATVERVLTALDELAGLVRAHDVEAVRFCATSAARDATNAEVLLDGVEQRVGVRPEVLSGDQEAQLGFDGAVRSLPPLPGPVLLLDIGGGSTELVLGEPGTGVQAAHSLDIGSVRLTERHLADDPPSRAQVEAAVADIDAVLDTCEVDPAQAGSVVGVAGTVTTVAAAVLGLDHYDRALVHHSVLRTDAVEGAVHGLLAETVEERRRHGYLHPGRADVIGAGGLILTRVLARTPVASVLVSEHDILDGIAWSLVPAP